MPNLLKKLRISSVDLCRRGANPLARIAMSKSGTGADWRARLEELLGGNADEAQVMRELKLIMADMGGGQGEHAPGGERSGGTTARGQAMGAEGDANYDRADSGDDVEERRAGSELDASGADAQGDSALTTADDVHGGSASANANDAHGGSASATANDAHGASTSATANDAHGTSTSANADDAHGDSASANANDAHGGSASANANDAHGASTSANADDAHGGSDSANANDAHGASTSSTADASKLLAHERALNTARRYEMLGMDTNALAQRLENLRALDEAACDDYEALLEELAEARRVAPLMKEYGSARSAGNVLERRVAEVMRAQPGISRAEAVVLAYQAHPDIPEVL